MAFGNLSPQPGTEPVPPAMEAHNFNHWTFKEVLTWPILTNTFVQLSSSTQVCEEAEKIRCWEIV